MVRSFSQRTIVTLGLIAAAGCTSHTPPLPTYPRLSDAESLRVLAERAHAVRTVSGEGLLTLTRPDGESVRLDAVTVSAPPDKVRLRAWKFGQAVFDLTLNDTGVYLITPEDSSHKQQIQSAGVSAAQLARTWSLLSGGYFDGPGLTVSSTGNDDLRLRRQVDGQTVLCDVDRPTLTPRRYTLVDPQGRKRFTLTLDRYTLINGIPWPRRTTAVSDTGTIVVDLRSVDLNTDLPPGAFKPPRRAEKLP
jgi:outer membrane lipoprotein-sorting protein